MVNFFFIVFGTTPDEDFSNIKSIATQVIPNIGETIIFSNQRFVVIDKVIDYSQVQQYELDDPDRGGEMIYVFVKQS